MIGSLWQFQKIQRYIICQKYSPCLNSYTHVINRGIYSSESGDPGYLIVLLNWKLGGHRDWRSGLVIGIGDWDWRLVVTFGCDFWF